MIKKNKIIAVIPARKNSKEIKKKNLIKLNGFPLISYSINYAKKSKLIDRVFVSTDGNNIASVSKKFGAEIIMRPKNLSNDTIMADYAVVHAIDYVKKILNYNFDYVVFLQPTTPLRQIGELDKAIKYCVSEKFDTVFSSIDYKPFLWRKTKNSIYPVSFDPYKRKRRQIINDINETGSYYITKREAFKNLKNRFGKKISNYNSDFLSFFEIDSISDFNYIKELFKTSLLKNHKISLPKKIK
jgi:CMP-N,N'-diacetyllegionaminic acid synthase